MVFDDAAPMDPCSSPSGRDAMRVDKHVPDSKFRRQDIADERLLGLALDHCMQADHRAGLPPKTFFSHNSERVYRSRHSARSASLRRRNVDSLPTRSTTTTSCGSNLSMRDTD